MKNKRLSCQVLVAGAGISGCCAAVSSARAGAKTLLLEDRSFPGGIAVADRHSHVCGLKPKPSGLAREITRNLAQAGPKSGFRKMGKLDVFSFSAPDLELVLRRLLKSQTNLKVIYNCRVKAAVKKGHQIISVKALQGKDTLDIFPRTVIDSTGSAELIKKSKADHKLNAASRRQLAGFKFSVKNLADSGGLLPVKVPYYLHRGTKEKKLPHFFKFTTFAYGKKRNEGTLKINLPSKDAPQKPGKYALTAFKFLRNRVPEFKNSHISWISPQVNEREGRRLWGKHVLSEKEVLNGKRFTGAAAKGYWPIEFWHPATGQKITYLKKRSYDIPPDCLRSRNIDNLFAAGRCISADPRALASCRVMGTCIQTGEMAGREAAKIS